MEFPVFLIALGIVALFWYGIRRQNLKHTKQTKQAKQTRDKERALIQRKAQKLNHLKRVK